MSTIFKLKRSKIVSCTFSFFICEQLPLGVKLYNEVNLFYSIEYISEYMKKPLEYIKNNTTSMIGTF